MFLKRNPPRKITINGQPPNRVLVKEYNLSKAPYEERRKFSTELEIYQQNYDFSPKLLGAKDGILYLQYIEGLTLSQYLDTSIMSEVDLQRLFQKLQNFTGTLVSTYPVSNKWTFYSFQSLIPALILRHSNILSLFPLVLALKARLKLMQLSFPDDNLKFRQRRTHNDMNLSNLLILNHNFFLVDYEFSRTGCWLIDYVFLYCQLKNSGVAIQPLKERISETIKSIDNDATEAFRRFFAFFDAFTPGVPRPRKRPTIAAWYRAGIKALCTRT